jgi:sugar transferase EpsL
MVKRNIDLWVSCFGLLLLGPLIAVLAMLVKWRLGSPVLFRQQRPGLRGKLFLFLKFRTMSDRRDSNGELMPDDTRLDGFGRWLRSTSLDELPQLWNVLKGEMSLVGPRPLLASYLDRYDSFQQRRHEVKPGITGWAQIQGRNALNWDERFQMDVWYVDNRSTALDLRILALTVWKVFRRESISQAGHVTMPEFLGAEREEASEQPDGGGRLPARTAGTP